MQKALFLIKLFTDCMLGAVAIPIVDSHMIDYILIFPNSNIIVSSIIAISGLVAGYMINLIVGKILSAHPQYLEKTFHTNKYIIFILPFVYHVMLLIGTQLNIFGGIIILMLPYFFKINFINSFFTLSTGSFFYFILRHYKNYKLLDL